MIRAIKKLWLKIRLYFAKPIVGFDITDEWCSFCVAKRVGKLIFIVDQRTIRK